MNGVVLHLLEKDYQQARKLALYDLHRVGFRVFVSLFFVYTPHLHYEQAKYTKNSNQKNKIFLVCVALSQPVLNTTAVYY